MSFETKLEAKDDYLHFTSHGQFELDAFLELLKSVISTAKQRDVSRAFIDIRGIEGTISTFERFQLGACFADQQLEQHFELQLCMVGMEPIIDESRFGETVARNRGANSRVFTDVKEGMEWLLKDVRKERIEK